jgi:quinol monooxygenase YgiN
MRHLAGGPHPVVARIGSKAGKRRISTISGEFGTALTTCRTCDKESRPLHDWPHAASACCATNVPSPWPAAAVGRIPEPGVTVVGSPVESHRTGTEAGALTFTSGADMLIASLVFHVQPDKRSEFVSAVGEILDVLRSSQGCLGCRLVTDCENEDLFVMTSEWDNRTFLERYLASTEFQVLEGTRILLCDGPALSIDELVSRRRAPRPKRHKAVNAHLDT